MYGSGAGQADRSLCEAAREGGTLKHGEVREVLGRWESWSAKFLPGGVY